MKPHAHSPHFLHRPSTFTCLLGFPNTLPPQIFNHLHNAGNTQPLPHTQINTSLGDKPTGRDAGGRPAKMHDTAPHTRYTHATNTKYIYSTPERALMSTITILVHPSLARRHSTCSHPDCDLRIRLTEGGSAMKGRREEMTRGTAAPRM